MKNSALKALSALLALGVLGLLVTQASVAGCRSANPDPPAITNAGNDAPKGSASAPAASAPAASAAAASTSAASPPPEPTFLPASKAGPVLPWPQEGQGSKK